MSRTTIIGICIIIAALGGIAAVLIGKATFEEAGQFFGGVVAILTGAGLIMASDNKGGGVKAVVAIGTLGLLLTSCRSSRVELKEVVRDSIRTEVLVKYRDTTIQVNADSAIIMAMVQCPDLPAQIIRNGRATVKVEIRDRILRSECSCDSVELKLKLADRTINTYRSAFSSRTELSKKSSPGLCAAFGCGMGAGFLLSAFFFIIFLKQKFK